MTLSAVAPEGSGSSAWFGMITDRMVAVAGSQADKYGFDDPKTKSGAFSFRFQHALKDVTADTNEDGQISIAEAVAFTRTALKRDKFDQTPTVAGQADDVALFSTSNPIPGSEKYKTVHAVIVGINKYKQVFASIQGAVNDAKRFVKLLNSKERGLFGVSSINLLTDEQATTASINNAIAALRSKVTKDDLVVFYFAGIVAAVGKGDDIAKVIYPTDANFENGGYLRISEIVEKVNSLPDTFFLLNEYMESHWNPSVFIEKVVEKPQAELE